VTDEDDRAVHAVGLFDKQGVAVGTALVRGSPQVVRVGKRIFLRTVINHTMAYQQADVWEAHGVVLATTSN